MIGYGGGIREHTFPDLSVGSRQEETWGTSASAQTLTLRRGRYRICLDAIARVRVVRLLVALSPIIDNGNGPRVIRTAAEALDDARHDHFAQPVPDGSTTARRRARPQRRYIASVALATPDCISCAFITGESVIFAPRPMK
jgi:hypothetical protein